MVAFGSLIFKYFGVSNVDVDTGSIYCEAISLHVFFLDFIFIFYFFYTNRIELLGLQ